MTLPTRFVPVLYRCNTKLRHATRSYYLVSIQGCTPQRNRDHTAEAVKRCVTPVLHVGVYYTLEYDPQSVMYKSLH